MVDPGADHRGLAGGRRHAPQARQLALDLLAHLVGQLGGLDRRLELAPARPPGVVGLPQLAADRLQLLAQVVLALRGAEGLLGLLLDVLGHPQHLQQVPQLGRHQLEPRHQADRLEHRLLVGSAGCP